MTRLWMLEYGTTANLWDEYLRMFESTCGDAMVRYFMAIMEMFDPQYLRETTAIGTQRLMEMLKATRWPSILRYLDRMHWRWKPLI